MAIIIRDKKLSSAEIKRHEAAIKYLVPIVRLAIQRLPEKEAAETIVSAFLNVRFNMIKEIK